MDNDSHKIECIECGGTGVAYAFVVRGDGEQSYQDEIERDCDECSGTGAVVCSCEWCEFVVTAEDSDIVAPRTFSTMREAQEWAAHVAKTYETVATVDVVEIKQ